MFDHVITALWFLLAICILVPIHEYGHYYAMRVFGIRVLKFSVGFGQRLWGWTDKHGTEFVISAIPLGGYVKPLDERNEDVAPEDIPYTLNAKPEWQRIIVFFAGPFANFVLAVAFYWLIMIAKGTVSYSPVIGEVVPDSLAAQAGLSSGQEIVAVDGIPAETRKAVRMQLLKRLGETGTLSVTTTYPDTSLTYDYELTLSEWLVGEKAPDPLAGLGFDFYVPPIPAKVNMVVPDSAAYKAGVLAGDTIVSVDGLPVEQWSDWADYVQRRPEQNIALMVERAEVGEVELTLTPEALQVDGKVIGRAGIGSVRASMPESMVRIHRYGALSAFTAGIEETWDTAVFIVISMKKLIFAEISPKNLSGPIGIAKVAASYAEVGFWAFLAFLAHLSVVLGVMNLLPVPMLDGGHIVFAVVEWVKGSPVSEHIQAWSFNVGLMLLMSVMVVAFYNDIWGA